MKKQIRAGAMGWDDGYAFRVQATARTKRHGRIFVVEVVHLDNNKRIDSWLEAMLESKAKKCVGPDCEGTLPERKWFKR